MLLGIVGHQGLILAIPHGFETIGRDLPRILKIGCHRGSPDRREPPVILVGAPPKRK
jgi:hypothetical protein